MKIKLSIRLYLFIILTSCTLLVTTLLSIHSGQKFMAGFNTVISDLMKDVANDFDDKKYNNRYILGYHATNDWKHVPRIIKDKFLLQPKEQDVVHRRFVGKSLLFPPEKTFELMLTKSKSGQLVYISKYHKREERFVIGSGFNRLKNSPVFEIIMLAMIVLVVLIALSFYVFRKIAVPVEALHSWAKLLEISNLDQQVPYFKFKELQALARVIHSNVRSVNNSIEREQEFLSFASHELRTPITILRTNSILLDKISPNPTIQEKDIRDRVQRASTTMKNLTETLLWLSRGTVEKIKYENFDIEKLLIDIVEDCSFLLKRKNITVALHAEHYIAELPLAVTQILLTNLISNAFQHSLDGQVIIKQHKTIVEIVNQTEVNELIHTFDDMSGFGLGLKLVQKIVYKFNWYYESKRLANGYSVKVSFEKIKF